MDAAGADFIRGINCYALVKHGDLLLGVLWVSIKPARPGELSEYLTLPNSDVLVKDWPADVRLEVTYLDNTSCKCNHEEQANWTYQVMDPSIARLPLWMVVRKRVILAVGLLEPQRFLRGLFLLSGGWTLGEGDSHAVFA
jgi:hypothetical protein